MLFQLTEDTIAQLATITSRAEKHAPAASYGIKIEGPNTLLDLIDRELRPALYLTEAGQEIIPGVPQATPKLRTPGIGSVDITASYEGWTLHVDHGIDGDTHPLTFGGCKVDKFTCAPSNGGTITLSFRVGTSDIDAEKGGAMLMKVQQPISIRLIAPEVVDPGKAKDGGGELFGDSEKPRRKAKG